MTSSGTPRTSPSLEMTYTLNSISWPESVWKRDKDHVEELTLSVHGDGFYGDFSIRWIDLGSNGVTPMVRAFNDSWKALALLMPILEQFNEECADAEQIIEALDDAGWKPSQYHGGERPWRERQ